MLFGSKIGGLIRIPVLENSIKKKNFFTLEGELLEREVLLFWVSNTGILIAVGEQQRYEQFWSISTRINKTDQEAREQNSEDVQ